MLNKKEYWLNQIKNCSISGLSQKTWCEENKINVHTFRNYVYEFRKAGLLEKANKEISKKSDWLIIDLDSSSEKEEKKEKIILNIKDVLIEIPENFSKKSLENILEVLRSKC